ncbi:MAG TPA: alternate-type signal peptide domain-containing protein, partial [Microbacterium sp.]|nr:alternate-type signal peptide domain-containing protein [Microbacterium sp.]
VLLLGGGGTLAYWSTTATLGGGTVVSGDLDLQPSGASSWTLTPEGGTAVPVTDLAAIEIVPGDTLTLAGDFTITLIGDNLVADLAVADLASLPTGILPPAISVTDDTGATFSGDGLTAALNGEVVSVEVAFQFDPATSGTDLQTTDFVFEDVALTLTQVDPTP